MKKDIHKFKQDKYRRARGGWSRVLQISCAKCGEHLFLYQKDGAGHLKRMYLDRIISPPKYSEMRDLPIKKVPALRCSRCKTLLGTPYIYEKEKRPAFRLYQDAVAKRIVKAGS